MSLISFFLHHGINQIVLPPRKSTFDSQMLCPRQSWQQFSRYSLVGATLENKTALPVFLYVPPLRYKPRIKQQKNMPTTMVNAGSSNPHSKYEPNTVVRTFPTLRHPLAPSRQGALTLRSLGNHFVPKKSPISTRTRQVRKSPKTYAWGEKAGPFFIANSGLSRTPPPLKVRDREWVRECILR